MIKEITKPTSKQTVTAVKSGDFSEVKRIRDTARQNAADIFQAVASGSVPLIWYDLPPVQCQSGAVSFLRYILTRSTKKENSLQLTCIEVKNGVEIPTSDHQYIIPDDFRESFRDLPQTVNINFLE